MSIFRTSEAKKSLTDWHYKFRERIGRPTESVEITTSFGPTHVLVCGPAEAPPVVLFHGALASSAHALAEVAGIADHFKVHAVDVIGQSPLSAEVRPEVKGNTYGRWAIECLDKLGLETAAVVGVSWGGFVALRAVTLAPERVSRLSLLVPAGIVNTAGFEPFTKLALPLLLHRLFGSSSQLEKFVKYQLTTPGSDWSEYLAEAIRGYKMDFRPPRLVTDTELAKFKAPVQVFGAELDLSFPGPKLLARAAEIFPNLVEATLLKGNRHAPATDEVSRQWLTEQMVRFLSAGQPDDSTRMLR